MTKQDELNEMIAKHEKFIRESEQAMVKFALEHNLHLYLGEYDDNGKTLQLEDNSRYGKQRGEWLHSSETC